MSSSQTLLEPAGYLPDAEEESNRNVGKISSVREEVAISNFCSRPDHFMIKRSLADRRHLRRFGPKGRRK